MAQQNEHFGNSEQLNKSVYHIGDVNKMVDNHIGDTNKMITAVDYIFKKIDVLDENSRITISVTATKEMWKDIYKQAKAMEKEQIKNAFDEGQMCEYQYRINSASKVYSETYYNETYNK